MYAIIFGTRFRVPFLYSEISYFWGKIKKKRFGKI